MSPGRAEPLRTTPRAGSATIAAIAPKPSTPGMLRSMSTTSGEIACEADRLAAVERSADDLDPLVGREDQLERIDEQPLIVGYEDTRPVQ